MYRGTRLLRHRGTGEVFATVVMGGDNGLIPPDSEQQTRQLAPRGPVYGPSWGPLRDDEYDGAAERLDAAAGREGKALARLLGDRDASAFVRADRGEMEQVWIIGDNLCRDTLVSVAQVGETRVALPSPPSLWSPEQRFVPVAPVVCRGWQPYSWCTTDVHPAFAVCRECGQPPRRGTGRIGAALRALTHWSRRFR